MKTCPGYILIENKRHFRTIKMSIKHILSKILITIMCLDVSFFFIYII